MNGLSVIFVVSLCVVSHFTEAVDGDASIVVASQSDDQKDRDTSDGPVADSTASHGSTASDDVNCTTLADVTTARRSLCPAQCTCWPLDGPETWIQLTVNCSGRTTKTRRLVTAL